MNTLKAIITICCFGFIYFSVNGQSSDLTETSLSFSPAVPGPMSAVYSLNGSRLFRNFSTGIFSPDTVRVGNTFGFSFLTGSRLSINTAAVIPSDIALYNLQNIQYRSDGTNLAQEIWTIGRNPKVNDPPKGFF